MNGARSRRSFLFDDYAKQSEYDVMRLINQDIVPQVPREAVEFLGAFSRVGTTDSNIDYQMALLDGTQIDEIPLGRLYSSMTAKTFVPIYQQAYCYARHIASRLRSKCLRGVEPPIY